MLIVRSVDHIYVGGHDNAQVNRDLTSGSFPVRRALAEGSGCFTGVMGKYLWFVFQSASPIIFDWIVDAGFSSSSRAK